MSLDGARGTALRASDFEGCACWLDDAESWRTPCPLRSVVGSAAATTLYPQTQSMALLVSRIRELLHEPLAHLAIAVREGGPRALRAGSSIPHFGVVSLSPFLAFDSYPGAETRIDMNDWRCPLCGHDEAHKLFDSADVTGATSCIFAVVQCCRCHLFSLRPRPQARELLSLYPQDYEPLWTPLNEETSRLLRWMRRRHWSIRCRPVRRVRPGGGQILDLGCATGLFLHELCRGGRWQGIGVDINEGALAVARRQAIGVLCGEADRLGLSSAFFDVVTMWDVIEHVPDPVGALAEVCRILRPGGVLLLSTPNSESWQARLWGKHWGGWDVPRHLQVFSSQTLCQLLENAGFEVVRRFSFPMERFYAVESARRYLQVYAGGSVRVILQRLIPLMGMAAWPLFRLIDQVPSASSIVLEAHSVLRRTPVRATICDEGNN